MIDVAQEKAILSGGVKPGRLENEDSAQSQRLVPEAQNHTARSDRATSAKANNDFPYSSVTKGKQARRKAGRTSMGRSVWKVRWPVELDRQLMVRTSFFRPFQIRACRAGQPGLSEKQGTLSVLTLTSNIDRPRCARRNSVPSLMISQFLHTWQSRIQPTPVCLVSFLSHP